MIKIDKIEWLSLEAKEAQIYMSDDNYNIICFCQPFEKDPNNFVFDTLYTLNATNIVKLSENSSGVQKLNESFQFKISGKIVDKKSNLIEVGDFLIELDNCLPNDLEENDYVSFICDRIDLY